MSLIWLLLQTDIEGKLYNHAQYSDKGSRSMESADTTIGSDFLNSMCSENLVLSGVKKLGEDVVFLSS